MAVVLGSSSLRADQKFDTLEAAGNTYSNVTVLNRNATHIFITHSKGFASFRITELSREIQAELGYAGGTPAKVEAAAGALGKLTDEEQLRQMQEDWARQLQHVVANLDSRTRIGIGAALGLFYLFYCYCCLLICRKAGYEPGLLVWLPVLQMYPLFKAAKMSGWNFLLMFLPLVGFVVSLIWCFKICIARKKSGWLGLLFIFPLTAPFVFLYLAFADAEELQKPGVVKLQFT